MMVFAPTFRLVWRSLLVVGLVAIVALIAFRWAASSREVQALGTLPKQGGRLVATPEGDIYILERGSAEAQTVLFAHGTAAWSGLWLPTLEVVGAQPYRAIGYDLPPFGFSQHAKDMDYSRQRQADRILALIAALGVRPIVVAHSVGAGPVAEAVLRDPDAFAGLVLVAGAIGLNSHLDPSEVPTIISREWAREIAVAATVSNPILTKRLLKNLIHVKDAATDDVIEVLYQPMAQSGYTRGVSQWLPSLLVPPINALSTRPDNWKNLKVPTIFIWGDMDTVTPLAQAEELVRNTPYASLVTLPNVGHIPQIEAPNLFLSKLISALETFSK